MALFDRRSEGKDKGVALMVTYVLRPNNARVVMSRAWSDASKMLDDGMAVKVTVGELKSKRTLDQNRKMWAMLRDVAGQVEWQVDGKMQHMQDYEWKDVFSAGLSKHQRVALGIEGGFVMMGSSTSRMTIREMGDMIELMFAFGAEHGVTWSEG